jgi:hypothetical protein
MNNLLELNGIYGPGERNYINNQAQLLPVAPGGTALVMFIVCLLLEPSSSLLLGPLWAVNMAK